MDLNVDKFLLPTVRIRNLKIIEYNDNFISILKLKKNKAIYNNDLRDFVIEEEKDKLEKFLNSDETQNLFHIKNNTKIIEIKKLFKNPLTGEITLIFNDFLKYFDKFNEEKKAQLDFIVNSLDSFIWQGYLDENSEYKHSFVSKGLIKLTGYKPEELINKKIEWDDLVLHADLPVVRKMRNDALSGKKVDKTYRIKTKKGKIKWLRDMAIPYKVKGKVKYLNGYCVDVTKEVEINSLFKEVVKSLGTLELSFMIIQDKNGKLGTIVYANELFIKRTGYPKKEIINKKTFFDFIREEEREIYKKKYIQSKKLRKLSLNFKTKFVSKKATLSVFIAVTKIDYLGEPAYFIIVKDITKDEIYEENLRQAQKYEALGNLSAGIAHDFNNLLGGILGYVKLLKKDVNNNKKSLEKIEIIEKAGERATGLIKQLLGFSRRGKYEPKLININHNVLNILKILEQTLPKNIVLKKNLSKSLNAIYADPSQMDQVIINLIINSSQATKNGGTIIIKTAEKHINLDFKQKHPYAKTGKYIMLSIKDTGIGMDKETIKHVFEPFFTTKKQGEGTGLGLSTVYGIVKNHNGFITISSVLNKGTEIKVYIPSTGKKIFEKDEGIKNREIKENNRKKNVLIIDDEEIIRKMLEDVLKEYNFDIYTAKNGYEGLKIFRKLKPDIILLDIRMPVMDGKQAFEEIRKIDKNTKIIIMTGYAIDDDINSLVKDKNVGFIKKPFDINELIELVNG